ncbi:MAG TPA: hypothetical protein VKZ79_08900 [Alphaproteobacteria bacterium]|nr:hypothetical protein [Alphaproteobacteria bacterium]
MANEASSRNGWGAILALAALGFAVRAASIFLAPNIANADEIFQNMEQGYRALTGRGFVPWEYFYGIRSWIFPGLIAGIIKLCWTLGLGSVGAFQTIRLLMAATAIPTIVCASLWGRRSNLPGAGILCGGLAAFWPDLVFWSTHPLNEVLATAFLVPGIFLAEPAPGRPMSRSRILLCAFLLAWAAVLRVQLAPAAGLAWLWAIWPDWRRRSIPAAAGGLVPVVIAGAVDWATWGEPLRSLWLNALVNSSYGVAAIFGTSPWFAYFAKIDLMWGGATAFVALAAAVAIPRARLIAAAAAAILLAHMLIGHKEYRFIYPAIPLVMTLAGIGTERLLQAIMAGFRPGRRLRDITPIACVVWATTIASLYLAREYTDLFRRHAGLVQASFAVARDKDVCGVAIWGINWVNWSGEFSLGHQVPVYFPMSSVEFADRAPGFNTIIYRKGEPLAGADWTVESCRPLDSALPTLLSHPEPDFQVCVARRAGSCRAEPPLYPPLFVPEGLKNRADRWLERPLPESVVWGAPFGK